MTQAAKATPARMTTGMGIPAKSPAIRIMAGLRSADGPPAADHMGKSAGDGHHAQRGDKRGYAAEGDDHAVDMRRRPCPRQSP